LPSPNLIETFSNKGLAPNCIVMLDAVSKTIPLAVSASLRFPARAKQSPLFC
jgi:hypothetical protein